MEERNCVRCGEPIPAGSEYCPTCGAALDGTPYNRVETFYMDRAGYGKSDDSLGSTPKLIMVYGILAVIVGIIVLAVYGTLPGRWDAIADAEGLAYGMSLAQTQTATLFMGAFILISGITALIGGFLAGKRILYMPSLVLCAIASVTPLGMCLGLVPLIIWGIILLAIGLLMTSRIHANRDAFIS